MAIVHLFGAAPPSGTEKSRVPSATIPRRWGPRLHEHLGGCGSRRAVAARIHDAKTAIRWTRANAERIGINPNRMWSPATSLARCCRSSPLQRTGARSRGRGPRRERGSDADACIGVYPLASARNTTGLFPQGQATAENIAATSPTSYITRASRAISFPARMTDSARPSSIDFLTKLLALGVPLCADARQGGDHARQCCIRCDRGDRPGSIKIVLDRLIMDPNPCPSFGGGSGGGGRVQNGPAPGGRGLAA